MHRHARLMSALAVPFVLAAGSAAHAVILSDDFDGDTIDTTNWATSGGTIGVDGAGNLQIQSSSGSWSGASVVSQASDLNFFDAPLTFKIDGLTFGGTGVEEGSNYAMGYLGVGLASPNDTWAYRPTGAPNGVTEGVVIAVRAPGENATYELLVNQFHAGTHVSSSALGLNGLPTGMSLTLDGVAGTYVITLEGAEFAWGGDDEGVGATRTAALPAGMAESSFDVSGDYVTRMFFGSFNFGTVTEASSMSVGSASVVPEPATLGLIGAGLLLAVGRKR